MEKRETGPEAVSPVPDSAPPLMDRLKSATASAHIELESLPFFRGLANAALSRRQYRRYLGELLTIHEALEAGVSAAWAASPPLEAILRPWHFRSAALRADIEALSDVPAEPASAAALVMQRRFKYESDPLDLIGAIYVFEGSRLGGAFLSRRLGAAYGINAASGLAYFGGDLELLGGRWLEFKNSMNALEVNAADAERVIRAALRAFMGLGALGRELSADVIEREAGVA